MADEDFLEHFGVKGMKWGVRKEKDLINSHSRIIKKGTNVQNITSQKFVKMNRHLYAAYTPYDKTRYTHMMGTNGYEGEAYKNDFVVKRDIKLPSDKQIVNAFVKTVKSNPEKVARDMTVAQKNLYQYSLKNKKYFDREISKISNDDVKTGEKLTKQYIDLIYSNDTKISRDLFFGNLIREGFDGMSDAHDREFGLQDPLIIFNPSNVLGEVKSVKLTSQDLEYYQNLNDDEAFIKSRTDLSNIKA